MKSSKHSQNAANTSQHWFSNLLATTNLMCSVYKAMDFLEKTSHEVLPVMHDSMQAISGGNLANVLANVTFEQSGSALFGAVASAAWAYVYTAHVQHAWHPFGPTARFFGLKFVKAHRLAHHRHTDGACSCKACNVKRSWHV